MKIRIHGRPDEVEALRPVVGPRFGDIVEAQVAAAYRLDGTRAVSGPVQIHSLDSTDVVEVELEDGLRLWLRSDELEGTLGASRSREADGDVIEVPPTLPPRSAERGVVSWVIRRLRVLRVGPGKAAVEGSARAVAALLEDRLVPDPGLRRVHRNGSLEPVAAFAGSDPALVFLHGTASTTTGSFGGLFGPEAQARWTALHDRYAGRVFALEHRTLSVSPFQNALDLMKALPKGADLHLVSHSRGGLIGELLCRGFLDQRSEPFTREEIALFDAGGQAGLVTELGGLIAAQRPRVSRFVRVACPARGTTLADERLDRWLSILTNLIGLIPRLSGEPLYDFVKSFLLAVIRERANPRSIPGLEAMIPDSPFQKLINRPRVVSDADLSIIKGDLEGGDIFQRLKTLATDFYFREDHDLVVNTSAMDGGMQRSGGARVFFDQGPNVNHFSYFTNERTVDRLIQGLQRGDGEQGGFEPLTPRTIQSVPRDVVSTRSGPQPTVFVLPGIMGSALSARGQTIWIDVPQLAFGGLKRLGMDEGDVNAAGLLDTYYGGLIAHLASSHKVIPFPYDWRRSIAASAERFADALQEQLAVKGQPVRIVAHSMGGLVARAAFAQRPALWRSFKERDGARLVMLGVPNHGSHAIPMMLMSRDQTMHMLAALDFIMNRHEHLSIVSRYPGVLDLLPEDSSIDLFRESGWRDLKAYDGDADHWPAPDDGDLKRAWEFRQKLKDAPFDPKVMVYVAGRNITPDGIRIDPAGNRIEFTRTHEGDGRVPWHTGVLPGMPVWYTDAAHGDLARNAPAFPAIVDLLEHGTTSRLPDVPGAVRGNRAPPPAVTRERLEVYPDARDLAAAALGGRIRPHEGDAPRMDKVRIDVLHGNLAFARHPLMVGHYRGDTLAGAEGHLDRILGERLSLWRELGLYPGEIGTAEVILDTPRAPDDVRRGAIVVGLGDAGRLTPGDLQRALTSGLLRYAAVSLDGRLTPDRRAAGVKLKVSTLLVGSGAGGLPVAGCVAALLQALQRAHAVLGAVAFDEVEIIELYEDRAIQIWHEIAAAVEQPGLAGLFQPGKEVKCGEGGRRRIANAGDRTWWQPMTVTMVPVDGKEVMNFVVSAGLARAEATLLPAHRAFVDRFIQQAMASNAQDRGLGTPGRTLFELLIPDYLKDQAREDRSLRLVLDSACAAYPWELLDDRRPWSEDSLPQAGERDPPAVRNGLIRQLIRQNFRERVARPRGQLKALVIGDPRGDAADWMPPLDGAVAEAVAVADLLTRRGVKVERMIRDHSGHEVAMAMCAQDWNIIHIAAHGLADTPDGLESGVVLGKDLIMGGDVFNRLLPRVPDLVFLNCCHIGDLTQVADKEKQHILSAGRSVLASNAAVKLIEVGVSAVVAAGWAVDDLAARLFAETFYQSLFDEHDPVGLGEAARRARKTIYGKYRNSTTWGAYHVYGEPDWRPAGGRLAQKTGSRLFASVVEAINAVDRIHQDAQTSVVRNLEAERKRLQGIRKEVEERGWSGDPVLLTSLAAAYGELGLLEDAIGCYQTALASEKGTTPVRAIEQLVNLTVRKAVMDAKNGTASDAPGTVGAMLKRLDQLQKAIAAGPEDTGERHALRGACCKRLAQIVTGTDRDKALGEMANWYTKASKVNQDAYPAIMHAAAMTVTHLRKGGQSALPKGLDTLLDAAERIAEVQDRRNPGFWTGVAKGDALVVRRMLALDLGAEAQAEILDIYLTAWRRGGSRLKLSSVREQLDFLIDVLGDAGEPQKEACDRLRVGLAAIRDTLEAKTRFDP